MFTLRLSLDGNSSKLNTKKTNRSGMGKYLPVLLFFLFAPILFTPNALGNDVCIINGTEDFFKMPCDISGTFAAASPKISGISVMGADLTMELTDVSTSAVDLGSATFPIVQTRVLMKYKGVLRLPVLRFDTSRKPAEQVTGSSRIKFDITGAIEWREDVRGGTGRIEGGAWAPERPPDENGNPAAGVAGRIEPIYFDAKLDVNSLPVLEEVRAADTSVVFAVTKLTSDVTTNLGLDRGIRFQYGSGNGSTVRGCDPLSTCETDPDIVWSAPYSITFDLGALKPLINIDFPKGKVNGQLTSTLPVETDPGNEFEKATIRVFLQDGFIKEQGPDETDEQFEQRIAGLTRNVVDQCVECDMTGKSGQFSFSGIPVAELAVVGAVQSMRSAYYTIEATAVETEEIDLSSETGATNTVIYTDYTLRNVRPDPEEPYVESKIPLTPLDEIAKKRKLAIELTKVGPNNYSVTEDDVQLFLDEVTKTKTPEELEAVRRGVLAERLALSSARFAEPLINTMLGGFENLVNDLIDELEFKKGKSLAEGEKKLKALQDQLDAEKLKAKGWKLASDSEAVKKIKAEMGELIGSDKALRSSFVGKIGKYASKAIFTLVNQALLLSNAEQGTAKEIASYMETGANTVFGIIISQSMGGGRKAVAKRLIHEVLKDQSKTLLDGQGFVSYTARTKDSLDATLALMKSWNTENKDAFLLDRAKFNKIDKDMGDAVLVVSGGVTAYSTEIADALGGFGGDVIDAIGDLGGPVGKGLAIGTKIIKYTSNTATFGMPFITIYGVLAGPNVEIPIPVYISPALRLIFGDTLKLGLVEKGVAASFGQDQLTVPVLKRAANLNAAIALDANPYLTAALDAAKADLDIAIADLTLALQEDRVEDAIAIFAGSSNATPSFLDASSQFERAASHISDTALSALLGSENVSSFIGDNVDLTLYSSGLSKIISDLFFDILLETYSGPDDPLYVAERNMVLRYIETFRKNADNLATDATAVFTETQGSVTLPIIVVDKLELSSDTTGKDVVSEATENFTLTARIKNISALSVSGISAKLTVTSVENSITAITPLEAAVGSGVLDAADGADGSGADEAIVSWQFAYSGDPSKPESILLTVDLLEDGNAPSGFNAFGDSTTLEPAVLLVDADLDGLPDSWETDNGLDPTVDDSQSDADGDGLTNWKEFNLGTDPQLTDSDGDGLSDSEETTGGEDGFITDPLNEDTDGDGVSDAADGQPADGGSIDQPDAASIAGEPVVEVNTTTASLTKDAPIVEIEVVNNGSGSLSWTAASDNAAIVVVSPGAPDLRNGDGTLLIRAADDLDFDAAAGLETTVKVIDVGGADHDARTISILVGEVPTDNPPTDNPPTDNPPTDNPPTDNPPTDNPPADNTPTDNTPTDSAPTSGGGGGGGGGCMIDMLLR